MTPMAPTHHPNIINLSDGHLTRNQRRTRALLLAATALGTVYIIADEFTRITSA